MTALFFLQLKWHSKLKTYHFSPNVTSHCKNTFSVDMVSCETELESSQVLVISFLVRLAEACGFVCFSRV